MTDRGIATLLCSFVLSILVLSAHGYLENPDGEVEYLSARALWLRGDPGLVAGLPDSSARETMAAADPARGSKGFDVMVGRNGKSYSWFGIGHAVFEVPLYALGSTVSRAFPEVEAEYVRQKTRERPGLPWEEFFPRFFVSFLSPLFGAASAAVLYLLARTIGGSPPVAVAAALASVFATQLWPQSRECLSDTPAGFFLLLCCLGFVRWWTALPPGDPGPARPPSRALVLAGAAAGMAVLNRLLHVVPIVLVSALVLAIAVRRRRLRDLAAFAAGALPFAAVFLWFNWWRFGDPLEYGYSQATEPGFWRMNPLVGLLLLLLAPGKGVLLFSPTLWLALPAWKASRGTPERRALLFALGVFVLVLLVPTPFAYGWHSGWAWGVRFLTPAIALLVVTSCTILRARGALVHALLVAGLLVSLGGVLTPIHGFLKLAFSSAQAAWPQVPSELLQDHVFFHPRWSPIHGSWVYLAASLSGDLAATDPAQIHSTFGWPHDPGHPVQLEGEDSALGHLWYIGLSRRFGFPAAPMALGILLLTSLLGAKLARATRTVRCS